MLREFFLGMVKIHILYHASHSPVYGVELMQELSRHGYRIGPGTLYPILHKLEKAGYLVSQKQKSGIRLRRYYSITPAGQRILAEAREKVQELVEEIIEDQHEQQ